MYLLYYGTGYMYKILANPYIFELCCEFNMIGMIHVLSIRPPLFRKAWYIRTGFPTLGSQGPS